MHGLDLFFFQSSLKLHQAAGTGRGNTVRLPDKDLRGAAGKNFSRAVRAGEIEQASLTTAERAVLRFQYNASRPLEQSARRGHPFRQSAEMTGIMIKHPKSAGGIRKRQCLTEKYAKFLHSVGQGLRLPPLRIVLGK